MQILSISNCPLVESQGSGYAILNFSQGLRQRGHQLDLFGPESFEPFYPSGRAKQYRQALGIVWFVLGKIYQKHYDIIEFYGAESWLMSCLLNKLPQRQFILVNHSNGLENHATKVLLEKLKTTAIYGGQKKWYQFNQSRLFKKAFTQVDGVVAVSKYDHDYGIEHNYQNGSHLQTIEYGLLKEFLGMKVDFNRQPIIGYCGSWIARKGTQVMQTDIAKILQEFPTCQVKLIGVGNNFVKQDFFPSNICSRIEVIPFVESKVELRKIYQSLSILLVPSIYESFGLVIAEAMACGCAVVAHRTGFAASLNHRQEALIIDEPVSPLLYQSVRELLINEPLRQQIAQAGYQRVQSLRWDLAIDKLEKTYLNWLEEWRGNTKSALYSSLLCRRGDAERGDAGKV